MYRRSLLVPPRRITYKEPRELLSESDKSKIYKATYTNDEGEQLTVAIKHTKVQL